MLGVAGADIWLAFFEESFYIPVHLIPREKLILAIGW